LKTPGDKFPLREALYERKRLRWHQRSGL
jgi:hypothetical protein